MTQEEIIELAKQAGFEEHQAKFDTRFEPFAKLVAEKAIKEALAQSEQEPMAWMDKDGDVLSASVVSGKGLRNIPLYTTPPQSKPLTDEQIFEINNGLATWMFPVETRVTDRELAFARAIEAAHGIKDKNT